MKQRLRKLEEKLAGLAPVQRPPGEVLVYVCDHQVAPTPCRERHAGCVTITIVDASLLAGPPLRATDDVVH